MPNYSTHVSLVYNLTGQEVSFLPPMSELIQEGAVVSAATYAAFKGTGTDDDTAEFSGTSTLDTVSTTVDVASGHSVTADRTKLSLTATTAIVIGHRYLVANTQGQRELVTVRDITAGDSVKVEEALSYDYPITTSTFKGIRHYFTIPAAFIQDKDKINVWGSLRSGAALFLHGSDTSTAAPPYRIRWLYTAGISRHTWTTFDVVRRALKHNVGINDLREILPDVIYMEWISQRGQDFLPQLDASFEMVKYDIRMAGYDPDAITDPEILDMLIRQKWVAVIGYALAAQSGEVSPWLQAMDDKYKTMFEKAIGTGLKVWIDTGSSGAITPRPATQMWLRGR